MAYDEGLAATMRDDLAPFGGIAERAMFGGLAFMKDGHMVAGVHGGGAMYRVGKAREDAALALDGVTPMAFTGRPMGGLVEVADRAMADDALRARLTEMALAFVASLPPKTG